jgi:hypothetical protein
MIKLGFVARGLLLALFSFSAVAHAQVVASPAYADLGEVAVGQSSIAVIQFMNMDAKPVNFFQVYCSGDADVFQCWSFCSSIPAYGSCSVQVSFRPRQGDGLSRMVYVNGQGDGNFANATVRGTERKQ